MPFTSGTDARRVASGREAALGEDGLAGEPPVVRSCASVRDCSPCGINPSARSRGTADNRWNAGAAIRGGAPDLEGCSPPCAGGGALVRLNGRVKRLRTECRSRLPDGMLPLDASGLRVGVSLPTRSGNGKLIWCVLLILGIAFGSSEPTTHRRHDGMLRRNAPPTAVSGEKYLLVAKKPMSARLVREPCRHAECKHCPEHAGDREPTRSWHTPAPAPSRLPNPCTGA